MERAIKFLLSQQKPDGSWGAWGGGDHPQRTGPTGLLAYALMEAGLSHQHLKVAKALKWLSTQKEDNTYSLAVRILAFASAERTQPGKWRKHIAQDASQLWRSMRQGRLRYYAKGQFVKEKRWKDHWWDNSNLQFALLGMWIAYEQGIEIPTSYWVDTWKHWKGTQKGDGGWPYVSNGGSTGPMTAGGIASMFVCTDILHRAQYRSCGHGKAPPEIKKGLDWFDRNMAAHMKGGWLYYYLYGVERVALASGYKYFGRHDWYKLGTGLLLRQQRGNGSWGGDKQGKGPKALADTAFALLFLSRGRHPVAFNKLEYSGDWNNRPRALANLTRWMSKTFEQRPNWQIIHINRPVAEWHDAPILVISGAQAPKFSDAEIAKLRQYVQQGGMLFSVRECDGGAFGSGIRQVYRKMFPMYELKALGPNHPIYTKKVLFQLPPSTAQLYELSNGVRPLVIHSESDLMLPWQLRSVAVRKSAFQFSFNLVKYVADGLANLRLRGRSHWPQRSGRKTSRTITLARLKHSGNHSPEPAAYGRLAILMANETGVELKVVGPVAISDLAGAGAKVATLTGTGTLTLSVAEKQALKKFAESGGTLVVDAAGGSRDFANSAEDRITAIFGSRSLRPVTSGSSLYRLSGNRTAAATYRRRTFVAGAPGSPRLAAVMINDRPAVVFSRDDITAGLLGTSSWTILGYAPQTAWELMRNIILAAR